MHDIIMSHSGLVIDADGEKIELAVRKPGQVAAQTTSGASVFRGARSGNAQFDPASGRFAPKTNRAPATGVPTNPVPINESGLPQGVSQEEWNRRKDAVRDAARSIPSVTSPEDVANFLKERVDSLDRVDIQQFVLDVQYQKLDDLTDVLSQILERGRNEVSVRVPRSFAQRLLGELDEQGTLAVIQRLRAKGFSDKDITKKIVKGRIKDKRKQERLISLMGSK